MIFVAPELLHSIPLYPQSARDLLIVFLSVHSAVHGGFRYSLALAKVGEPHVRPSQSCDYAIRYSLAWAKVGEPHKVCQFRMFLF